jgi:TatD DNase family protein
MSPTTPSPLLGQEGTAIRLIDTHCHPQMGDYDGERSEMIRRSLDAGIGLIAIGTNLADSLAGIRLAEEYPNDPIYAAVGIHPTDDDAGEVRVSDLALLADNPKVVAIGETGLDYFRLKPEDNPQEQIDLFEQQIIVAQQAALPLSIHCRDHAGSFTAYDDVLKLLIKHQVQKFVMHCFSADWKYAEKFLELGGMISITGIITFSKSETLQEVVKNMPLERMMLETDAPFLAPEPFRGKRNEPLYVEEVAKRVAELRGVSIEEINQTTTVNAETFFSL